MKLCMTYKDGSIKTIKGIKSIKERRRNFKVFALVATFDNGKKEEYGVKDVAIYWTIGK